MSARPPKVRVCQPPPRLTTLVNRPGGMLRDAAVARAQQALESQRAAALEAITALLSALEAMIAATGLPGRQQHLLRLADQLIALATIFGLAPLEQAAKRLSELLSVFRAQGEIHGEALAVHVRAMRLLAASPDAAVVAPVMDELDRVLAHFGATAPC